MAVWGGFALGAGHVIPVAAALQESPREGEGSDLSKEYDLAGYRGVCYERRSCCKCCGVSLRPVARRIAPRGTSTQEREAPMAKMTPMQEVKERFGSKEELAKLLYGKMARPFEDESDDDFQRRIRTASNTKLLRLYTAHEKVEKDFSDKAGLVDAIMKLRYADATPSLQYKQKIEGFRITRLLDMHQVLARKA